MHRLSSSLVSVLVALSLAGVPMQLEAATAPTAKHDKAAIEALEQRFADAVNARDVDAIMKVYAPGATLVVFDVTPPRQYVGAEDYKKDWQGLFAAFPGPVKFLITDLQITTGEMLAYSHSIQDAIFTKKDGTVFHLVVRVTDVYRKSHGHWLIVHEHVSVPVDLDSLKPDLLSKP